MTEEKKEIYIKSIEEFDKWFRRHPEQGVIYRGLRDSRRYLSVSVYHRIGNEEDGDIPKGMPEFLTVVKRLIEDAKMEEHHQKNGKQMKDLQLLAELQHHGAATCLMDFTENPYVALWFACQPITEKEENEKLRGKKYKGSKIVALNTTIPENFQKLRRIRSKYVERDIDTFLGKGQLWIWSPPKQNQRIIAQQSVFVLGKELIEDKEIDETCFVHKKARGNILRDLRKQGISEDSLFCDFAGFAEQHSWHKLPKNLKFEISKDYCYHAVFAYQSNEFDRAIENCNIAIKINEKNEHAYFVRGLANGQNGNYDKAIADFDEVLKINRRYKNVRYALGHTKMRKDDYDGAIVDFSKIIQSKLKHPEAHFYRGIARVEIGKYKHAIADFNKVIGINDRYAKAYYYRGWVQYQLGNHEQSNKDYFDAKNIASNNSDFVPYDAFTVHKYCFKVNNKIVHVGFTECLKRQEVDHQDSRPDWKNGRIKKIGFMVTRKTALK